MLDNVRDSRPASAQTQETQPARKRGLALGGIVRGLFQAVLMIVVLAGAYVAMERIIAAKPERTARPRPDVSLPVLAAPVEISDARPSINLFGTVVAGRSVDVRSPVAGEVVEVDADLSVGQRVDGGDVLFRIDRFDYETALAEAEANLAQTRASIAESRARLDSETVQLESAREQLALAEDDLERARQLADSGSLTAKQVDDRRLIVSQRSQSVAQRQANLAIEQARLDQQMAAGQRLELGVDRTRRNLENTVVTAPFDGVVRTSNIELGRQVSTSEVAVSLYDPQALDVRLTLTDAQYGRVATDGDPLVGRTVDVSWTVGGRDYAYQATVTRIGADIAADRGGVDVFARLKQADHAVQIRPGAFVGVTVPDRLYRQVARLPETALYAGDRVYVITDENLLEPRDVRVAAFDGSSVLISDGLAAGETVMATRLANVEPGLRVSVPGTGNAAAGQAPQTRRGQRRPQTGG